MNVFQRQSLKTRVTLFTLAIFVFGIWSLSFYASRMLRTDMEHLLGEQQLSTTTIIAEQINVHLNERLNALKTVAKNVSPTMLVNPASVQIRLEQLPVLHGLFSGGILAYRKDGTVIAEVSRPPENLGKSFANKDYLVAPLNAGQPSISEPHISENGKLAEFTITVPILDAQNHVIGALSGVTDLNSPNFLNQIIEHRYGKTGGYLLVAKKSRTIIIATDKRRIMEVLPAPGINPAIDRFIQGYEGSAVFRNPLGIDQLSSVRGIRAAGWYVLAALPAAEAFAPIHDMQQRMLLAAILLTLSAGGLTWWMLRNQLSPMLAAVTTLATFSSTDQPPQPLPITSQDEIGELIGGFNHLLTALGKREEALRIAASAFETQEGMVVTDCDNMILQINHAFTELTGYRVEEVIGKKMNFLKSGIQDTRFYAAMWGRILQDGEWLGEIWNRVKNGEIRLHRLAITGVRDSNGTVTHYISTYTDITERKQAEDQLRIAAAAFETHEAIMITDADANIIRVNHAFEKITGYSAIEAIGKTPRILSSWRHEEDFYASMWRELLSVGTWSGEIWDRHKSGSIYPKQMTITAVKNEAGETTQYVSIFTDISDRKKAEEEIHNLAFNDALTGLPNRRLLLDRLGLALSVSARSQQYGALLFLDLDKFKTLNDTLGHDYGDQLLIEVGNRLKFCVREVDTVARLGGDEFVVLIENISTDAEDASQSIAQIAEKIRGVLAAPYVINDHGLYSSPSIGVCLFYGNSESVDELIKRADMAMYQAKDAGRNRVRFFDPQMQHSVETRAALESDLRQAIAQQQLHLYYQVQLGQDQRPVGAEALIRWIHPQRGMVSPVHFIPVAEDSALILEIGHWVLDTACQQIARWEQNEKTRHLVLAVNISAQQFKQSDFVEQIEAIIRKYDINPSRLKLELTESVALDELDLVVAKMHALRQMLGVSLSLDDFGTGYSSLSYLKQLPLDQLKIDQSFVRDMTSDSIDAVMVKTIIDMAHNFGLNVIAEGVETEAQLALLRENGCLTYQGYLFSKPIPLSEFEALLNLG